MTRNLVKSREIVRSFLEMLPEGAKSIRLIYKYGDIQKTVQTLELKGNTAQQASTISWLGFSPDAHEVHPTLCSLLLTIESTWKITVSPVTSTVILTIWTNDVPTYISNGSSVSTIDIQIPGTYHYGKMVTVQSGYTTEPKRMRIPKKAPLIAILPPVKITEGLYMGDAYNANSKWVIENVHAVLNCADSTARGLLYGSVKHYLCLFAKDVHRFPLLVYNSKSKGRAVERSKTKILFNALCFIKTHLAEGKTVFVHCRAGYNRSAAIVAAYLIIEKKMSCASAVAFLRAKRPGALNNKSFVEQLNYI
jgi:hypothetical protein